MSKGVWMLCLQNLIGHVIGGKWAKETCEMRLRVKEEQMSHGLEPLFFL